MAKNKDKEKKLNEEPIEEAKEVQESPEEVVMISKAELDQLKDELTEAKKKEEEAHESFLRERAEMSNYRKLIDRDQAKAKQEFKADVLKKFLAIDDDLKLACQNRPQSAEAAAWAEGLDLILRKFNSLFESEGLEQIDAEPGMEFDPTQHQAIAAEDSDEYESGEIIDVLQNGYKMGDRIIRPALVRVAK